MANDKLLPFLLLGTGAALLLSGKKEPAVQPMTTKPPARLPKLSIKTDMVSMEPNAFGKPVQIKAGSSAVATVADLVNPPATMYLKDMPPIDMEAIAREQFLREHPLPTDVFDSDKVPASVVKQAIADGQKWIFNMPYGLNDARALPQRVTGSMTIKIDDWDSFHYFSNILVYCLIADQAVKAKKASKMQIAMLKLLTKFFSYHRWYLDPPGEVYMGMIGHLRHWLCSTDTRLNSWAWFTGYHPAPKDFPEWDARYPGLLHHFEGEYCNPSSMVSRDVVTKIIPYGLGLMFEYASAKYANLGMMLAINPKLGELFGQQMMDSLVKTLTLAATVTATLLGVAGASSTIPIVGWVAAGIAAIGAFVAGMFTYGAMVERNRNVRKNLSAYIESIDKVWFHGEGIAKDFSGYRFGCLLPNTAPWNDVIDPLFQNFCLVNSMEMPARAVPQLPFYYLNLDFDFIASVALPSENYLILRPVKDSTGITTDFKLLEIPQKDLEKNPSLINLGKLFHGF